MHHQVLPDKWPLCTVLLAAFATGSATLHPNAAQAADARPKWAIIATEEGQNTGLADLMAIHIGKWKDVDLVDRDNLAEVVKELERAIRAEGY